MPAPISLWGCWHGAVLNIWVSSPIILALLSIAFCSLYGLSDEWHQSFVVGRESDITDWIADTSGSVLAILSLYKLRKGLVIQGER